VTDRSRVAPQGGWPPERAEFAPRLLAWFIDLAGIYVFGNIIGQLLYPVLYVLLQNDLTSQADSPINFIWKTLAIGAVEVALIVALEAFFLRAMGATPGQRLVGLLTVTSESGLALPLSRAVGRAFMLFGPFVAILVVPSALGSQLDVLYSDGEFAWVKALPWVLRVASLVWYVALAFTTRAEDGRGFHDLASRSVVVHHAGWMDGAIGVKS
jgi:hypothetical protein